MYLEKHWDFRFLDQDWWGRAHRSGVRVWYRKSCTGWWWWWLRADGTQWSSEVMQTLLVSLSSARQIYVSAVDSNIKCSVHLKSLSLPNMGTMKSLSLAWKHRQTDCKCVNVGGVLLQPFQACTCQPGYLTVHGHALVFLSRLGILICFCFPMCNQDSK